MRFRSPWLFFIGLCGCSGSQMMVDPCQSRKEGDLVITEVMIDPDGQDTGAEWVELYNATKSPIDLKGLTLVYRQGTATAKTHAVRATVVVAPGEAVAVGDVRSGPNPAWIGYSYGDALGNFSQTSGTIGVRCGANLTIDEYTYTRAARSGRSRMLNGDADPTSVRADEESKWCDAPLSTEYAPKHYGSPGAFNSQCVVEAMVGTCLDNGVARPVNAAQPGDLLITEVMASPKVAADAVGEWFEVLAATDVDLNGLSISNSTTRTTLSSMNCLKASAGQYVLLARSDDSFVNGALPPPLATYSLSLNGANNERLRIFRGDAGIDEAAFFKSVDGVSWQIPAERIVEGSIAFDVNDLPESFCLSSTRWLADGSGDVGTPGARNISCGEVPVPDGGSDAGLDGGVGPGPNECLDATTAAVRPLVRPMIGDLVITEVMCDPTKVADNQGEYFEVLVKRDVDLNGLLLANEGWVSPATSDSTTLNRAQCMRVNAGAYVVFARNADSASNGGLPPVIATFSFDLGNSNAHARNVRIYSQGVELDRMTFPLTATATPGASIQLVAGKTDVADNDNPVNLSVTPTSARYPDSSGDRGTPGQANVAP